MAGTAALVDLHADIAAKVEAKTFEVAAALVEAAPGRP